MVTREAIHGFMIVLALACFCPEWVLYMYLHFCCSWKLECQCLVFNLCSPGSSHKDSIVADPM